MTTSISQRVQIGNVGAFSFQAKDKNENEDGYYLVEFTGLPYTDQKNGALRGDCHWLYDVLMARYWYTRSTVEHTVDLVTVVTTDVETIPSSPRNMIRDSIARKEAEKKHVVRISEESHDFIMDEIRRRERLEYDPSRVIVGAEADSDSEDDD